MSSRSADGSAAPPVQHCTPLIVNWASVYQQCFRPSLLREAAAAFPTAPLDPRPVIQGTLHVELKQVLLLWPIGHGPSPIESIGKGTPLSITYIFGTIPGGSDMVPMPSPSFPRYAIVGESPVPNRGRRTRSIDRATGRAGGGGKSTHHVYGPWQLDMRLPDKGFSVSIVANVGKSMMAKLADELAK